MKNSRILIYSAIMIILQISFSANAQSGKVDFKAEQSTKSFDNYSSNGAAVGIVKTKTYIKLKYRRSELLGYQKKKSYEFGTVDKSKSYSSVKTSEFKPFVKTNKYQLNPTNDNL